MTPDQNDNKLLTKRVQASERTTVILSYSTRDAADLRALASSFTLKAGKRPSLSLLSRRALAIYSQILRSPAHRDAEIGELSKMVTTVPAPAPFSTRKAPAP
jgi:hypothetical protein